MRQPIDAQNVDYIAAPQAMQADLRKARQQIDRPPDWHQDLQKLHPGLALGPYWHPVLEPCWIEARDNGHLEERYNVGPGCWSDDDEDGRPVGSTWTWESRDWWDDGDRDSRSTWWTNRGYRGGSWKHRGGGGTWLSSDNWWRW